MTLTKNTYKYMIIIIIIIIIINTINSKKINVKLLNNIKRYIVPTRYVL